jgi:hypothetical protein
VVDLRVTDASPGKRPLWEEDDKIETLAELHYRVLRATEAATGQWIGYWSKIVGPLRRHSDSWALTSLNGSAEENTVVRSIAEVVRSYHPRAC